MPYFVHLKSEPFDPERLPLSSYADPASAHTERQRLDTETGDRYAVTFHVSPDESEAWENREHDRFRAGSYVHVPWRYSASYHPVVKRHYAHLSVKYPGLIAFTRNDEHGIADRQTAMKPGKYLTEFLSDLFTTDQINDYISRVVATDLELKITNDPNEIEWIYTHGPRSCMSRSAKKYQGHCHPSRVYGGPHSDLAVAYRGDIGGSISERALVWPEKKIAVRVYPNSSCALSHALKANGYQDKTDGYEDVLKGARIAAIQDAEGNGWIMPYLDGIEHAYLSRDKASFWLGVDVDSVGHAGKVETQCTQTCDGNTIAAGVTEPRENDSDSDDEPEYDFMCDRCDGEYLYDDQSTQDGSLCQTCADCVYRPCDECGNDIDTRDQTRTEIRRGHRVCADCEQSLTNVCDTSGCTNEWYTGDDENHGDDDTLCVDCVADLADADAELTAELTEGDVARAAVVNAIDPPVYRLELWATDEPINRWKVCSHYVNTNCVPCESADLAIVRAQFDQLSARYREKLYRIVTIHDRRTILVTGPAFSASVTKGASCEAF